MEGIRVYGKERNKPSLAGGDVAVVLQLNTMHSCLSLRFTASNISLGLPSLGQLYVVRI